MRRADRLLQLIQILRRHRRPGVGFVGRAGEALAHFGKGHASLGRLAQFTQRLTQLGQRFGIQRQVF